MKTNAAIVSLLALSLVATVHADYVDQWNLDKTPANYSWGADRLRWQYTPSSEYDLDGIDTKFGSGSQNVTVELRDLGMNLLASSSYLVQGGTIGGVTFTTPVHVKPTDSYYVTFSNVSGLGVNFTQDSGMSAYPGGYDWADSWETGFPNHYDGFPGAILGYREANVAPVPEPASMAALGLGLLGVARRRFRK